MQENYKLLLVDDEDEVRGRISSLIDKHSGFEVIGKAGNGHDAYELVEELRPDVVLTDIKMPFIDGIELARLLKRDFPTVKVAFISGYDEFKYAQEAIALNVISYLMKPLTSEDINHFLRDLKVLLDEEYHRKFNIEAAMRHYHDSLPLIINHSINSMLISSEISQEQIARLSLYGMNLQPGKFVACLLEVESSEDSEELIALEKLRVLLEELMSSSFEQYPLKHHLIVQNGIFLFVKEHITPILRDIDAFLYELLQTAEQYMNMRIRAGISAVFHQFEHLSEAYKETKKAIRYGKFLNTGRIVYISEVENKETKRIILDVEDIKEIENTAKFGTIEEIKAMLRSRKKLIEEQNGVIVAHDLFVVSLANIILNFAQSINSDTEDLVGSRLLETMMSFTDVDHLFEWTEETLLRLRKRYIETSLSRTDEMLEKAMRYVQEHYTDADLSLNQVCDYLDISISYLSMLMKREKNLSFNKYIVQVRMEKAKEYLRTTNLKIIDISLLCGYNEVYYFSHSFKKYTGESPKQYREVFHV
ncbi:MAG: response regulator [bacterium]|nr:response regulator [bacterium]